MKKADFQGEQVVYSGKIGQVIHINLPDGRVFEQYRRAPGIRIIIVDDQGRILVTREYRHETDSYDLRIPGGKVANSPESYEKIRGDATRISQAAEEAVRTEAREEVGIDVQKMELVATAKCGATVDWDLMYYRVDEFKVLESGQELGDHEDIEVLWMTRDELQQAIQKGHMQEWRTVGILLGAVFNS